MRQGEGRGGGERRGEERDGKGDVRGGEERRGAAKLRGEMQRDGTGRDGTRRGEAREVRG